VRVSTSKSVDPGFDSLSIQTKILEKLVFIASLVDVQHQRNSVENKPASSHVVSVGKALNGIIVSSFEWLDAQQSNGGSTPDVIVRRCNL